MLGPAGLAQGLALGGPAADAEDPAAVGARLGLVAAVAVFLPGKITVSNSRRSVRAPVSVLGVVAGAVDQVQRALVAGQGSEGVLVSFTWRVTRELATGAFGGAACRNTSMHQGGAVVGEARDCSL